jgi:uncharacterized OB-fold protein
LAWADGTGRGSLVSWTIVHSTDSTPQALGIVELEEGPWVYAPLLRFDDTDLAVGAPCAFVVDGGNGGEPVPAFAPARHA